MPDTMPYEYRTHSVAHRYEWDTDLYAGHKIVLTSRRRKFSDKSQFKSRCKICKWKDGVWWDKRVWAIDSYHKHIVEHRKQNPTLFGGQDAE